MYENYWESDEERDIRELNEIVHDNFIDNLKKGGQMPLVLPLKDEPQFRKLLTKKALKMDAKDNLNASTSVDDCNKSIKVESTLKTAALLKMEEDCLKGTIKSSKTFSPTKQKNLNAGVTIKDLIQKNDASLMLFQMPSSLGALVDSTQRFGAFSLQSQQQQGTFTSQSTNSGGAEVKAKHLAMMKSSATDYQGRPKHCLSGLSTDVEIGKLQILRSGRAIMNIGGHCMDILEAIPSQCFETAVCIETSLPDESSYNGRSMFGVGNTNSAANDALNNSIQVLGDIPYSFVCAYDLRSTKNRRLQQQPINLLQQKRENEKNNPNRQ